jgi:hypothetical protein
LWPVFLWFSSVSRHAGILLQICLWLFPSAFFSSSWLIIIIWCHMLV